MYFSAGEKNILLAGEKLPGKQVTGTADLTAQLFSRTKKLHFSILYLMFKGI